ncbi:cytochrome c oxidase subunit II [Paenibacillus sp. 481]|uniref:cytochrome c oxidase subunit II n=1 Tax=Paenibacillus sp. 481 TaxID=2835869 RepID=UPI001E5BD81D|nr:cytochrome c oxidase subunit II [Paenibacillus sp. 481]UHA75008.1 cytochrome c oxidase subunit II [Paenibacillus sp. 481]
MMKRWHAMKRLLPLFAGLVLLLSACGREDLSTLNPQGPIAEKQLGLMQLSITIMTFVVIVVFGIAIYVVIRYRRRPGSNEIPKQVEGSHKLEIIWTVIPIILLVILAVPTVKYVFEFSEDYSKDKDAVKVKVTSHLYWWEFEYPEYGIITAQDLVIPTGKKVAIELKTADVLHSFWIPSIAGKMDTNPEGNKNKMYIETNRDGVFRGKCAELCGPSHALMDFKVKSVSNETFTAWVSDMKGEAKPFSDDEALNEKFKQNCLSCHAIDNAPSMGPNLKGIGSRESVAGILLNRDNENEPLDQAKMEENLREWIKDPEKHKPANKMPAVPLTDSEMDAIVDYLANYKLDSLKAINKQ